ncbi:5-dehydro-4-deoxyglucarate dehydratase [Streptomyces sp. DvalAA-14]|uniref:5-dehydro-4-deoxyglucarate dehydratase n=1 Tax=unclassified Streptomyces TaxID=2593676 RepID=UPI00081AF20D|nr:5-dehydro-4-deoxyglucarate dehydratase [Streptomyces sp. DvalAA-14]MYS21370.1 5-dehydro-4-deoxyglucarate dehydratase [Streptomyces sp. SID4948]SCD90875.1 5-dehydro-4-deoxyglucarate dehydratase [Streptomyces sp. DvalAA-14]
MPTFDGVLFFPVTPFTPAGEVDPAVLAEHVGAGLDAGAGAVFAACGTGEFHALEPAEYERVVRTAVEVTAGRVPVYAGAGGALPLARRFAGAARAAGADGLLLMPPYLVQAPPAGLVAYTRAVAESCDLPLIVYHRHTARYDPRSAAQLASIPGVVGLKDGVGDLGLMADMVRAVRAETAGGPAAAGDEPFRFFNGLPTAEASVPAYRGIGVELYSSAVFCFAPEISLAYYKAVTGGDDALVERLLAVFFRPLIALRDLVPGYAVSLVKAAVRQRGLDVGGVRPPLLDPTAEHLEELRGITRAGLALSAGAVGR